MLLIRDAELDGRHTADVRCRGGRVIEIGRDLSRAEGEDVIEAGGGALLPGLHDHHLHLFALAAVRRSVDCGPPRVADVDALADALRAAPGEDWIRGVGYHESVAGMLDRGKLDALMPDRPVRIQHRSGKMWFINSAAARRLDLDDSDGQLFRRDDWLRERTEPVRDEDVLETSHLLASYGVTGITDATPSNDDETANAIASLGLLQCVHLMGNERLARGHLKIMLDDYALPDIDAFRDAISTAHERGRPVAIHCVTRTELVFALSMLLETGTVRGDRIEHASVTDDETMSLVSRTGVTVVTQPNFIFERGDQYLADVDATEQDQLYRCRGFLDAGVPLGGGTDAPFGRPDPWLAIRSAVLRRTASGKSLGGCEALTPEEALALFTSSPDDPGGPARRVEAGESADLCLLDRDWASARESLRAHDVAATIAAGVVTFRR